MKDILGERLYRYLRELDSVGPTMLALELANCGHVNLATIRASRRLKVDRSCCRRRFLKTVRRVLTDMERGPSRCPLVSGLIDKAKGRIRLALSTRGACALLGRKLSLSIVTGAEGLGGDAVRSRIIRMTLGSDNFGVADCISRGGRGLVLRTTGDTSSLRLGRVHRVIPRSSCFRVELIVTGLKRKR